MADDQYGPKIIENIGLQDFAPDPVTRVSDLFKFRSYFLTQFGPRYVWLIKLSVIEWPTLSAEEKKLHTALRKSFLTSYVFGAEAIIQHWLWKTLKNATQSFGPLLQVFATDYDATTACGARTSAKGAHARSAGGRASVSTIAKGAHARSVMRRQWLHGACSGGWAGQEKAQHY